MNGFDFDATYSPEDNKLRLYAAHRLPPDLYAQVKAAGFRWAAKQELFVAPAWTPSREDLALELAGEIGDEDTSLGDRAKDRAERFDGYRENRREDAQHAEATVSAIADGIPLGQPILVGHHSERHARRDAKRIENGMRRAIKMWETADYWRDRAAGAIRNAKYKQRPDVRARRIKKLEAEQRKHAKQHKQLTAVLGAWTNLETIAAKNGKTAREVALILTNNADHGGLLMPDGSREWSAWSALNEEKVTVEYIRARRLETLPGSIAHYARWIAHDGYRLEYERALLAASDYTPPPKRKSRAALPLLNYAGPVGYRNLYQPGEIMRSEAVGLTRAEWAKIANDYKATRLSECGTHRIRTAMLRRDGKTGIHAVYLTDSKQHERPGPAEVEATAAIEDAERLKQALAQVTRRAPVRETPEADRARELKQGASVEVVTAPALFPTPPDLARRMVELADIEPGARVLEPSAGTGRLVDAAGIALDWDCEIIAVELAQALAWNLRAKYSGVDVREADFLSLNGELGTFDRIIMNPPYDNGTDIKHILHARGLLKPGGRLVALCANGPRQQRDLQSIADHWEDLPAGTFSGTQVRAALLVLTNDEGDSEQGSLGI